MASPHPRSVLATQVVGGVLTVAGSLFALFLLLFAMPFALSTCEDETSTTSLAVTALVIGLGAAVPPALTGLVVRVLGRDSRTWFGIAIGWTVVGALAALGVTQVARCT
jgi:hypothetical protein